MFCNELVVIARYDRSHFFHDPMPLVLLAFVEITCKSYSEVDYPITFYITYLNRFCLGFNVSGFLYHSWVLPPSCFEAH